MTVTWKPHLRGQAAQGDGGVGGPDDQQAGRGTKRLEEHLRLLPSPGQGDYLRPRRLHQLVALFGNIAVKRGCDGADRPASNQPRQLATKQGRGGEADGVNSRLPALHGPAQRVPLAAGNEGLDQDVDRAPAAQPHLERQLVGYTVARHLRTATVQDLHRPLEDIGLHAPAAHRAGHASAARHTQARPRRSRGRTPDLDHPPK